METMEESMEERKARAAREEQARMRRVALGVFAHIQRVGEYCQHGKLEKLIELNYHINGDLYRARGAEDERRVSS